MQQKHGLGNGVDVFHASLPGEDRVGTAEVNHGTAEVIENWFRSHSLFGANTASTPAPVSSSSVADEIAKLGQLRSQGLLTEAEFEAQKARLLG